MALDYVALVILIVVLLLVVYGLIAIWGLPYEIAKKRNHPHQDAIGAAIWVSLFTLGVLWPFLWIWAMLYRPDRGWGLSASGTGPAAETGSVAELENRVAALEQQLQQPR
jgi:type VI protein secretion system component VasK